MEKSLQELVESTNRMLIENKEWEPRYKQYASDIMEKTDEHSIAVKQFQVTAPLYKYSCISGVKGSRKSYDIRFKGQSVATVHIMPDGARKTKLKAVSINDNLDFSQLAQEFEWGDKNGTKFRKYINSLAPDTKTKSPEHAIENRILAEFNKKSSKDKALIKIQPVKLSKGRLFFQFPTPLSASDINNIKYSGKNGGGIDILARIKTCKNKNELVIFELKDENTRKEPANKVIKQAVVYGTFLANLLKNNSEWWQVFGHKSDPKNTVINIATLMPEGIMDASFEGCKFDICDGYQIELHTLYFKDNEGKLEFNKGSLLEKIQK